MAQALDPLRLFHQLEQLQKAVFRCAVDGNPFASNAPSLPIRVFSVELCITELVPVERSVPDPSGGLLALYQEQEKRKRALGWRRTQKDSFLHPPKRDAPDPSPPVSETFEEQWQEEAAHSVVESILSLS